MTLYDEIEEDMNCFYKNDEDDNKNEEEKEIVVNDLELAMRKKHLGSRICGSRSWIKW